MLSGVIDLQEDPLHSSDVINSTFAPPIQLSIVKRIYQKQSSEDCITNSKKKVDFDDLIEMINRNGSSSKAATNFHSTSYDNHMYSKISHKKTSYDGGNVVDSQQDFLQSSGFTDPKYPSPFEFRSLPIPSPRTESSFIQSLPIEALFIPLPQNQSSFISSSSSQSSFNRSPSFQLSPINQEKSFKT